MSCDTCLIFNSSGTVDDTKCQLTAIRVTWLGCLLMECSRTNMNYTRVGHFSLGEERGQVDDALGHV